MLGFVVTFIVGAVCIALGISNMKGNISSLHEYHRKRVSEEDRIPFGKRVGLGTIIIGGGIISFSALSIIGIYTYSDVCVWIANAVLIASLVVGCIICFGAMIKYNKGIF